MTEYNKLREENELTRKFDNDISNDISNNSLLKLIAANSALAIYGKLLLEVTDIITTSYLGHLKVKIFSPFFTASFIQNVFIRGIGFGITRTANMHASRYFGERDYDGMAKILNQGRIAVGLFCIIMYLLCIVGGPIWSFMFPSIDIELVTTFLIHSSFCIFINLFVVIYISFLNIQNHYLIPPIIDTIVIIFQLIVFEVMFKIFDEEINSSERSAFIVTAWCLNITYILQIILYSVIINAYKPCQGILKWIRLDDFKGLSIYYFQSIDFIAFFLSHFMSNEELMILINKYYNGNSIEYQAYGNANRVNMLIQKISMAFSFLALNMTGSLLKRGYLQALKKFIKIYFIYSFSLISLVILIFQAIANPFSTIFTNDQSLLELIPTYIRLIMFSLIPNHLEISLQSMITGFKKQKILAYISLATVLLGGFLIGYILIFLIDLGIYGVFISMFLIELIIAIISLLFLRRIYNNI
jgi:Na+-driven multidrug efflux pump